VISRYRTKGQREPEVVRRTVLYGNDAEGEENEESSLETGRNSAECGRWGGFT
jgi:hypothetical protein